MKRDTVLISTALPVKSSFIKSVLRKNTTTGMVKQFLSIFNVFYSCTNLYMQLKVLLMFVVEQKHQQGEEKGRGVQEILNQGEELGELGQSQ